MLEFKNVEVVVKKGLFEKRETQILNNISFTLKKGESLGIVGESGSGKSTIANVILRIMHCSKGMILIDGKSIFSSYSRLELAKKVQLVTQNPETSFDPDITIHNSLREVLKTHKLFDKTKSVSDLVSPLLKDVGLELANLHKLPRQYSGGELQRFSMVRALLVSPDIIIFDEADSMLDTSIRVKLFELLNTLRLKYFLTYIYITHDIRVLPHITDNVLIISSGKILEHGTVEIVKYSTNPFIAKLRNAIIIH